MRWGALLAVSIVIGGTAANPEQASSRADDRLAQSPDQRVNQNQLLIFVAEGPPNSCGPGCNRWIAIEGSFDRGSGRRVREFLEQHATPKLPIYFHSKGGWVDGALEIGRLLRRLRMTAGVGRTALQLCAGEATSGDCRRLLETSKNRTAQLRLSEGFCASACVYALVGASRRTIDPQARLGVHRTRPEIPDIVDWQQDRSRQSLARYVGELGIDPALIEYSFKIEHSSIRVLTRGELDRFGLISKEHYETPWVRQDESANTGFTLFKAFSRRTPPTQEQLTTIVGLTCRRGDKTITAYVRRERALNDSSAGPRIHIKSDETEVWSAPPSNLLEDFYSRILTLDQVLRFLPKRSLEYSETFEGDWADRSNTVNLSIEGLEAALMTTRRQCVPGAVTQPARLDR
jgi:hypothetical protein